MCRLQSSQVRMRPHKQDTCENHDGEEAGKRLGVRFGRGGDEGEEGEKATGRTTCPKDEGEGEGREGGEGEAGEAKAKGEAPTDCKEGEGEAGSSNRH